MCDLPSPAGRGYAGGGGFARRSSNAAPSLRWRRRGQGRPRPAPRPQPMARGGKPSRPRSDGAVPGHGPGGRRKERAVGAPAGEGPASDPPAPPRTGRPGRPGPRPRAESQRRRRRRRRRVSGGSGGGGDKSSDRSSGAAAGHSARPVRPLRPLGSGCRLPAMALYILCCLPLPVCCLPLPFYLSCDGASCYSPILHAPAWCPRAFFSRRHASSSDSPPSPPPISTLIPSINLSFHLALDLSIDPSSHRYCVSLNHFYCPSLPPGGCTFRAHTQGQAGAVGHFVRSISTDFDRSEARPPRERSPACGAWVRTHSALSLALYLSSRADLSS
jgi:hypothetical protein